MTSSDAPPVIDATEWGELGRRLRSLRRVDLFLGTSRDLLISVAIAMKPVNVVAGATVCREGEIADQFYLIDSGTMTVSVDTGSGQCELGRLGPGQMFGEMGLLGEGRRTATVRAQTAAQLWSIGADDFKELLAREPDLDAIVRRTAALREAATRRSVFEVENRNLAALAEGRDQVRIGRGLENDLRFDSRMISRHHAVMERSGDGYRLRDLDTPNGTYVNGERIHVADLADGDEIRVADEHFVFDRREIHRLVEPRGMRVDVTDLTRTVKGGKKLIQDISLSILPGEFVALVGGSGAGKTTLLDAISGVHPATSGQVLYNAQDYYSNLQIYRQSLGYVPQDDIIHKELSVRKTLHYAARLRLPPDTSEDELNSAVDDAIGNLSLTSQAGLPIASLSGGQRKRASIGVELLTRPRIFFLDEPTSGLDPATDSQMMRLMRRMADEGSTVVLTTHATKNVAICDKVVFLARGGYLAFAGTPNRALQYFGVTEFDQIYDRLADERTPEEWAEQFRNSDDYAELLKDRPEPSESEPAGGRAHSGPAQKASISRSLRQWLVLSSRNLDILVHSRANWLPLFIAPLIISVLLLILFRSGAFSTSVSNPTTPVQILFFLSFGSYFFGVSYGLQEICKEFPIFYRERLVNLRIIPYVFSKLVIKAPILAAVLIVMLVVLRISDRLPDAGISMYAQLALTAVLAGIAGMTAGLFASAVVKAPEQASLILPALIMPGVLFSGAILPVPSMTGVGQVISGFMIIRWGFEGLGSVADVNGLFTRATSPLGKPLLLQFGDTFSQPASRDWGILAIFIVVFLVATCAILARKSRV